MKKLLSLLLALTFAFALVSCGDEEKPETPAPAEPSVETPAEPTAKPQQQTPAPQPVEPPKQDEPVFVDHAVPNVEAKTPVEKYFELNAKEFLAFVIDGYSKSSGAVCRGSLAAVGDSVTVNVYVGGLENLSEETKSQIQSTYDTMGHGYSQLFQDVKKDVPELKAMIINLCEEDGDKIVEINVTK